MNHMINYVVKLDHFRLRLVILVTLVIPILLKLDGNEILNKQKKFTQ